MNIKLLFITCLLPFMGICQTEDSTKVNKTFVQAETLTANTEAIKLIKKYCEILKDTPDNEDIIFKRGLLYIATKEYKNAKSDFDTLVKLEGDEIGKAYFYRGLSQLLLYETISGCEDISKAKELGYETDSNLDLMCNY